MPELEELLENFPLTPSANGPKPYWATYLSAEIGIGKIKQRFPIRIEFFPSIWYHLLQKLQVTLLLLTRI